MEIRRVRHRGTVLESGGVEQCELRGSSSQPVAILFGPGNGPLSERLVREVWDEAGLKHDSHLIGFAIDPKARQFIDSARKIGVGWGVRVWVVGRCRLQIGETAGCKPALRG